MAKGDTYSVDLEELIENYVWKLYRTDLNFLQKLFVRRSNYYVDIPWGYVDFKHETEAKIRDSNVGEINRRNVELYFSEYENRTTEEQSYTFSTSRQTVASTRVSLQESYKIGVKTNLEVNLGPVVKMGGGLEGEFSVTDTKEQEFSETLTWNINTSVKVPKRNKARASLHVFERPSVCDFTTTTTVSLPKGKLPCSLRRKHDDKLIRIYAILNLPAIVDGELLEKKIVKIKEVADQETNKICEHLELTTKGVCRNISYKNQRVLVECQYIDNDSTSTTAVP